MSNSSCSIRIILLLCWAVCGLASCKDSTPGTPGQDSRLTVDATADIGPRIDSSLLDRSIDQDMGPAKIQFAAIADIHPDGDYQNLKDLVAKFDVAGVDFFVVLGDIPLNGALRGIPEKTADVEEIISSLTIIASLGLPVYVVAGNHETHTPYDQAMADLKPRFANIFDLAPLKVIEHQGLVLAALSGAHNPGVVPAVDGFLYGPTEIEALSAQLAQHEGPVALLTHDPPQTAGPNGIDYVEGSGNVGDPALSALIGRHNISFSLSGHIHFGTPRAVDDQNNPVSGGTWSEKLYLNVGATVYGSASLVAYEKGKMMFTSVEVP